MITERLEPGLNIIFIGFNPSISSHELGFNYAGRNNRFYRVLYMSGLTKRLYTPEQSPQLLADYGYGFTNIVARPTIRADQLTPSEYKEGRKLLKAKLEKLLPRIACFVGKGVYLQYSQRRKADWGFQTQSIAPGIVEFVGPSTSGLVRMTLEEQVAIYRKLFAGR